ncbi:protein-glutamate O-methyltransferase CheR [Paenibacillus sp. MER TA 81-3]|uniref:CheR family methyltransferase n=1 Tax=Paenibacillus sp. MER TA 81-3 TaxID=2939573 RepID=UPI00203E8B6C|nr:protein-glutamate O-methyltransferase CheR [Paenibacillus sp. MER TA 81-3]MCM3341336.1 protein-glutamate O-methyltransferase CheR [Paenibacillus sp. MER TA 81-3]
MQEHKGAVTTDDQDYFYFVTEIKKRTGIDLTQYKEAQMRRRLTTLRLKNGYSTFRAFYEAMKSNEGLLDELLDRMTINVSEFWRNPNRWETLRDRVLPALTERNSRLKCWSAACSTGEEPYTLAMILDDAGLLGSSQVMATDIDDNALARAKEAFYIERALKDVPASFKQRYFSRTEDGYRVSSALTRNIQFQKQNLLEDAFTGQQDLIICRNVMIYFTEEAKHQLYFKFSEALKPGGVLFVGSTEQIFNPNQYGLETMETFFYRKM